MKRTFQLLRMTLAGGLLFLVPFVVLVIIIDKALMLAQKLVAPLAAHIQLQSVIGVRMEKLLAVGALLLFCFLAGCLARTALAQRMVKWLEATVLSNLPGYEFFKSVGESILGVERTEAWKIVLIRFEDSLRIGFLVERLANGLVTVFVPDAPNTHAGEVCIVASDRITPLDATPAATLKCLKRLGIGSGALLGGLKLPPPAPTEQPAMKSKIKV